MKIGVLIPTTSNGRTWKTYVDSDLFRLTIKTFLITYDKEHEYIFYIGIDKGDPFYENKSRIVEFKRVIGIMKNVEIEFMYMEGIARGHLTVMWNRLFKRAYDDQCDYFFQCGDDIEFRSRGWVNASIAELKKSGGFGLTGPINHNPRLLTQSFVSRKHMDLFGYYFPEEIINWFCDDWINLVYRKLNWFYPLIHYECYNAGGAPRYSINNESTFTQNMKENHARVKKECEQLVERDVRRATDVLKSANLSSINIYQNKIYICGCVYNCAAYLKLVFDNIHEIISLFEDYQIIAAYDNSQDDTLSMLKTYADIHKHKMVILENPQSSREPDWNGLTHIRTRNISNARNSIMDWIRNDSTCIRDQHLIIMMDFDDVCSTKIDTFALHYVLKRDDWDSISFNHYFEDYYDIWALSIDAYPFSCWHWLNPKQVVDTMKYYINVKILETPRGQLIECQSAFNGFAIYRISKFDDCNYDWNIENTSRLIGVDAIRENEKKLNNSLQLHHFYGSDCEHRHFHLESIRKNNARIRISPMHLFASPTYLLYNYLSFVNPQI